MKKNISKFFPWQVLLALIIASHVLLCLLTIPRLSPTFDEPKHLASGYLIWTARNYTIDHENDPLFKMWGTLPLLFIKPAAVLQGKFISPEYDFDYGCKFLYACGKDPDLIVNSARMMMIPLSALTALLIFFFSRDLYGSTRAGLIGALLWCFLPLAITHATVFKAEAAFSLFAAASFYFLFKWYKSPDADAGSKYPQLFFSENCQLLRC